MSYDTLHTTSRARANLPILNMPHPTPRVFIIRHGETEWSLNGRHTGTSDIPLTENGVTRIESTGAALVGPDRLIVRSNLAAVYVSPRTRARKTLHLLLESGGIDDIEVPGFETGNGKSGLPAEVTEDIREWDYGNYEGITSKDIKKERSAKGLKPWDIWRDGCPGGEYVLLDFFLSIMNSTNCRLAGRSPEQITTRLDRLIEEIRTKVHKPALDYIASGKEEKGDPCDVIVVAHGHILRAFAARWIGRPVHDNPSLLLEAGGVGCLRYVASLLCSSYCLLTTSFDSNIC